MARKKESFATRANPHGTATIHPPFRVLAPVQIEQYRYAMGKLETSRGQLEIQRSSE
jgi:hypothetical protein